MALGPTPMDGEKTRAEVAPQNSGQCTLGAAEAKLTNLKGFVGEPVNRPESEASSWDHTLPPETQRPTVRKAGGMEMPL